MVPIPASVPVTHIVMVPIDTINLFVDFTTVINLFESTRELAIRPSPPCDFGASGQIYTATLPVSKDALDDDDVALLDSADSVAVGLVAESITPASIADSIFPVSNPGDFEDGSILPSLTPIRRRSPSSARNATPTSSWWAMFRPSLR
jgi:hypothetical protein